MQTTTQTAPGAAVARRMFKAQQGRAAGAAWRALHRRALRSVATFAPNTHSQYAAVLATGHGAVAWRLQNGAAALQHCPKAQRATWRAYCRGLAGKL